MHDSDDTDLPAVTQTAGGHDPANTLQSGTNNAGLTAPSPTATRRHAPNRAQSSKTVHGALRATERVDSLASGAEQRMAHSRLAWQMMEFINANLGGSLPIWLLAAQVHLSAYYFARLFKQMTGMTPHQFVIRLRLAAAAQFLAGTTLPIADIAYRTGFASQSQLAKLFRRWTGLTPIEYRRGARAGRCFAEGQRTTFGPGLGESSDSKNVVVAPRAQVSNLSQDPFVAQRHGRLRRGRSIA